MKRRDAFTLTEMLVLVPITALLGALLLASLEDAKQTLQAAACLNNMRQWGLAIGMYCNDYHDYMPYKGTSTGIDTGFNLGAWFNVLPHYINQTPLKDLYTQNQAPLPGMKSIFICPSSPNISYTPVSGSPYFSYALNRVNSSYSGRRFTRSNSVLPGQVVLFSESENNSFPFTDGFFIGTFGTPPGSIPRHSGGDNFVFVDGHAQWYRQADYSRTKAESTNPEIDWAKRRVLYWFPCGDADTCGAP